jgi:hypothetical protein
MSCFFSGDETKIRKYKCLRKPVSGKPVYAGSPDLKYAGIVELYWEC